MFSVNQYRTPLINDLYDLVNFNTSIESLADDICEVCKAFYQQGREDAIDEFVISIKERCHDRIFVTDEKDVSLSVWESDLDSLAKQLKEQNK